MSACALNSAITVRPTLTSSLAAVGPRTMPRGWGNRLKLWKFNLPKRLRIAQESAESWRVNCLTSREYADWCKARMFESWNVIRAQQKGLNRQRRLIKRL